MSPSLETLPALFRARRPADDTLFLETPAGERLTYGDLDQRSARFANALRQAGVRPGHRVAVRLEKSVDGIVLYVACVRAGAVFVPMNPTYTSDEVDHLVGDAEPTVVVDDPAWFDSTVGQSEDFDDVEPAPDDLAAILYTSGTTGRPKGAMLSHRNLATNAAVLHQQWGFQPDDVLLHALPVFHTHGLFVATNCVLANGTGMVYLPRFDVDAVLEALAGCTVFMGVPTYYTRLLEDRRLDEAACRHMRLFVSGSAPLLMSTHGAFHARTGHVILERYGMTETSMITSNPFDGERRPGTVGFPLPGVDVRLGDGEEIEVRGPNVLSGYWRRPELAATEFRPDGFFRTGDVGAFDPDGYLRIVGRAKDLIISGGLNVYPKEVEDVLDALDGVVESAVVGVPDADLGEAVVAVVVAETGRSLDPETIRQVARGRLAGFKVPKRVEVVEALPRNAMGKVTKAALRTSLAEGQVL